MNLKKLALILIFGLVSAVILPAAAEEETQTPARSQIERAVVSYAANGTRDDEALASLASLDPNLGEKWLRIMDLWETPVEVNEGLPDDLPEDDSLCLVGLGFQLNPDGTMREELIERTLERRRIRKEQLDKLTALGVDFIQGYYFSKPLPSDKFIAFIRERNNV